METRGAEQLRAAEADLSGRQEENRGVLMDLQKQTGLDRAVLEQQRAELQEQLEAGQQLVRSFLLEELQQDVPTGEEERTGTRTGPGSGLRKQNNNIFIIIIMIFLFSVIIDFLFLFIYYYNILTAFCFLVFKYETFFSY